ncbi:hypothetical protein BDV34DRAFT_204761 [Aspergillus parasiticus]|uniref:Uncharacterized protein n=1 Tax=Aspergillus parasiticus TaxID=5067 RepID=A0A5N6D682_ASPPA|nr:hypothetical protein BDV34DRAFT_204761 [Aspergillus parasiticus]
MNDRIGGCVILDMPTKTFCLEMLYSISRIMTMIAILFVACFAFSRLRSRVSTRSSGMSRAPMSLLAMNPCP